MRHWTFHPLVFYPLAALLAAAFILISLKPQAWPREPAPVAGQVVDGSIVFEGMGFNTPDDSPEQDMTVERDFWGNPLALHIAQLPNQPLPTPAEQGVRILMTPEQLAMIEDKPLTIEVSYEPLQVNPSSALAVSIQSIGPATWITQTTPAEPSTVRFEMPAQFAVTGIGLRAIAGGADQAYGIKITRIRITPHA
ncbi:MAG: hypothetical protein AB7O98_12075 [Hyphomonadaceae bacterium]